MKKLSINDIRDLEMAQEDDVLRFSFNTDDAYTEGIFTPCGLAGIWMSNEVTEYIYDTELFFGNDIKRRTFVALWNDAVEKGWPKKIKIPFLFRKVEISGVKAVFEYNIARVTREAGMWNRFYKGEKKLYPANVPNDMDAVSERIFGKGIDEVIEDEKISGTYE